MDDHAKKLWDRYYQAVFDAAEANVGPLVISCKARRIVANEILWQYWCANHGQEPFTGGNDDRLR